jgi:hypothetical protein
MSADPAVTSSLRRSLLRRLAAPLSMLALMSGLIAYWLAWQYTQHVIDRSLADLATAISKQIQIAGPDAPFTVPPLAQAMFSDPAEALIYRISDGEQELAGDPKLRCAASTCAACITRTCSRPSTTIARCASPRYASKTSRAASRWSSKSRSRCGTATGSPPNSWSPS